MRHSNARTATAPRGFTLIELVAVTIVVGILGALGVTATRAASDALADRQTTSDLTLVASAVTFHSVSRSGGQHITADEVRCAVESLLGAQSSDCGPIAGQDLDLADGSVIPNPGQVSYAIDAQGRAVSFVLCSQSGQHWAVLVRLSGVSAGFQNAQKVAPVSAAEFLQRQTGEPAWTTS